LGAAYAGARPDVTEGLAAKIAKRIRAEGPLTVAAYMAMAAHDPADGYYTTRAPIGAAGDFTTAPEISQIFGELIGLWCAERWERLGRPDPVILAELGPGRGLLMRDFLRAACIVPGFRRALRLHLVEMSSALRVEQQRRLGDAHPVWVERIEDLPDGPMLLVANEFLDALPIRQFVRCTKHWAERMVALDNAGRFAFVDGPESPVASLLVPPSLREGSPGTIAEVAPAALAVAAALGNRLTTQPGAALFIDYGYFPSAPGSTLRAISRHRATAPLAAPGCADLSAHVDFATFAEAARAAGADTHGPVTQGRFLTALGAGLRAKALSERATPSQRATLENSVRRLTAPNEMGELFKVIALTSPGLPVPAGFEDSGHDTAAASGPAGGMT
jgi:NADH dehydrogenase [ubiquinone] 1 alpha subcomplex assembly factor 7